MAKMRTTTQAVAKEKQNTTTELICHQKNDHVKTDILTSGRRTPQI